MPSLEFQPALANSPPKFVMTKPSPDIFEASNVGGANVSEIQCCMLANDRNLQIRGQIKPLSRSHFCVEIFKTLLL